MAHARLGRAGAWAALKALEAVTRPHTASCRAGAVSPRAARRISSTAGCPLGGHQARDPRDPPDIRLTHGEVSEAVIGGTVAALVDAERRLDTGNAGRSGLGLRLDLEAEGAAHASIPAI